MKQISSSLSLAFVFLIALTAGSKSAYGQTTPSSPTQYPAFAESTSFGTAGGPGYSPRNMDDPSIGGKESPPLALPGAASRNPALNPETTENAAVGTMEAGGPVESGYPNESAVGTTSGLVRNGPPMHSNYRPFHRIAFAAKMGTMGAGFEVAVPLSRRTNLRSTGNIFSYSHTFNQDGVDYTGTISLRSMQTTLDWFPFRGGFHISPGFFAYGGNNVKAHASVPGGQIFTLNDTDYRSSAIDPINGSGKVTVNNAGPGLTVGWGNLLPRNRRHFSFPFEVGAIYEGAPKIALQLGGSACDSTGINCSTVASDPSFQQNLIDEQVKLNKDVQPYKFYPIISFGFAVNF